MASRGGRDRDGRLRLYVDGTQVDTLNATPSSSSITEPFVVGGSATGEAIYDFEGLIDEVVVYPFDLNGGGIAISSMMLATQFRRRSSTRPATRRT